MENKFPPLYAQVAKKLAAELTEGNSPLQKPIKDNGMPAFVAPVNPLTGKGYSALNALNLGLKGHDDPRWLSANDASYASYLVKAGSKGTLINFPKNTDIQAVRTPDGGKIIGEDGLAVTKTVQLEKTENAKAFLFNGTQIEGIPPLDEFLSKQREAQSLSPVERAEKLISDSKAVIIHGGAEAYYDQKKDEIHLPEKASFENDTKYYQAAIHQLAHWTGHESRLNRSMEGRFGSPEYGREEFRAAIAAMLVGAELKTGHNFGPHAAYSSNWAKMLKEKPFEMARAVNDVQKITRLLLGNGQKREQEQTTKKSEGFKTGDEISYADTTYKVLGVHTKSIKVEDASGTRMSVKLTDGLFKSLLEAKNNPMPPSRELAEEKEQTEEIGR